MAEKLKEQYLQGDSVLKITPLPTTASKKKAAAAVAAAAANAAAAALGTCILVGVNMRGCGKIFACMSSKKKLPPPLQQ